MPDLINMCKKCKQQFKLRDEFLEHLEKEHGVSKEKHGGIANEF